MKEIKFALPNPIEAGREISLLEGLLKHKKAPLIRGI
jgi:hypothetical protein